MAISDIKEFAHLTEADVEAIGLELDAIRRDIEDGRGERDARYIRGVIRFQRTLELVARAALVGSRRRPLWWFGASALGLAKIIENMEIGHNVMHGQWDWMNDPEVHSSTWEWDIAGASAHWKQQHNYTHHKYTNIIGMDDDIGYTLLRVTRDMPWKPMNLGNLFFNALLCAGFEWGVGMQHLHLASGMVQDGVKLPFKEGVKLPEIQKRIGEFRHKAVRQIVKDYVLFPALTGRAFRRTLTANATANLIRNVWANAVIFCGHFPDGAEKFTTADIVDETRGQWYLRQMLGSANFDAGRVLGFLSGHLSHQIEHHLFPDLPSNHYHKIQRRVRELCEKYDLPYTTGSFAKQYFLTWRTIAKLSLPNSFLTATSDNAPETSSELRFRGLRDAPVSAEGGHVGLSTAYGLTRPRWQKRVIRAVRGLPGFAPAHPSLAEH